MTKNHEIQVVRKSLCNSYIASVLIPSFDLNADDLESEFKMKENKTKNRKAAFLELCVSCCYVFPTGKCADSCYECLIDF